MADLRTILVVEDDDDIREAVADLLRIQGLHVLTAEDGLAALELLQESTPELIITDIMMPRMNGYQLYERVSASTEWMWIPFIFLSARGEEEDVRFGKELGADDYLRKPVDPGDLVATVLGRLKRFGRLGAEARGLKGGTGEHTEQAAFGERFGLSPRESEVLELMVEGLTNNQIAQRLNVAPTTAKTHVSSILSKLNVASRVEAVARALGKGDPDR